MLKQSLKENKVYLAIMVWGLCTCGQQTVGNPYLLPPGGGFRICKIAQRDCFLWVSPVGQLFNPPAMLAVRDTGLIPEQCRLLGQEDSLEKGMATDSSILAWRIPWTEKPDGLQSMGWQRV